MSRGTLFVRFPDGSLRYGIYNGTCDIVQPRLFDAPSEAWDAWFGRNGYEPGATWCDFEADAGEPVDVATNYGGGSAWKATATREAVTSALDRCPYDEDWPESTDGLPEWAVYPEVSVLPGDGEAVTSTESAEPAVVKVPGPHNCTTDDPQLNVGHLIVANLGAGQGLAICGYVMNVADHPSKHVDCTCDPAMPHCPDCVAAKVAADDRRAALSR